MRGLFKLMSVAIVATLVPGIASGANTLLSDSLDAQGAWTVNNGGDSAMVFGFDYSTVSIPEAPNSVGGAATTGLKATSNETLGVASAITAVQDLASLGHVAGSPYRVQVDIWGNFGIQTGGDTEFSGISVGRDAASSSVNGASFIYTADGGSSRDYRMYKNFDEQRTSDTDPVEGPQYAVASNNGFAEPFASAFPPNSPAAATGGDAVTGLGGQQVVPENFLNDAGDGGFTWATLEALVSPSALGAAGTTGDLGTVRFSIRNNSTGTNIVVGTIDNSNGDSTLANVEGYVGLLYADLFPSLNTSGFNFGIFDNVIVTEVPEPASVVLFGLGMCGMLAAKRRR